MSVKELKEKRAALMAEINAASAERFAEIRAEVAKLDFQIEEAEKEETRKAKAEEDKMRGARDPQGGEKRDKHVFFDNKEDVGGEMTKADTLRYAKTGFGKQVRAALQNLNIDLSKNEKRALGVAFTTTSETYTAPSADANGINNGGIFIPQPVLLDLLETDEVDSPFLRDVKRFHIKGALVFPYVVESSNNGSKGKAETVTSTDRSIHWGKLSLAQGNYPLTIEVTMELLAMTDEEFADYLLADLNSEINILLSDEALYGTGTDESIEGATVGATVGTAYAAGGEAEAIKAGLKALSRRAKRGAKIYVADSVALDLAFEKDSEGRYIFPIYNNTGISTIATIPVEVDEALKDGDILIGNPKNYILNFIKPVEIYPELKGKDRVIQYTAHLMVGGKAAPNKFYYVSKATA